MEDRRLVLEIRDFLNRNRPRYASLLETVRLAAHDTQRQLGGNCVTHVYSRGHKQPGDREIKSVRRIMDKIQRSRLENPAFRISDINDIIGLTVVIQYPDQADRVLMSMRNKLARDNVVVGKKEEHKERGYHAAHAQCVSNNAAHANLWCEVQVKTMLHDAWSSKMHDLTYNPGGQIDVRLVCLMETLGDTMQMAERQSIELRNLIREQWEVEGELREKVRRTFIDIPQIREFISSRAELAAFNADVESRRDPLDKADPGNEEVRQFVHRATELGRSEQLSGWLASFVLRGRCTLPVLADLMDRCAEDWLEHARRSMSAHPDGALPVLSWEVSTIPLCFYAVGDLERAIEFSERILLGGIVLHDGSRATLQYNLATFLTEDEYFRPTTDVVDRDSKLKEVRRLIAVSTVVLNPPTLPKSRKSKSKNANALTEEVIHSTQGFIRIAFSSSAAEIREGIRLCEQAPQYASLPDKEVAELYADFFARLGWRKLLGQKALG